MREDRLVIVQELAVLKDNVHILWKVQYGSAYRKGHAHLEKMSVPTCRKWGYFELFDIKSQENGGKLQLGRYKSSYL